MEYEKCRDPGSMVSRGVLQSFDGCHDRPSRTAVEQDNHQSHLFLARMGSMLPEKNISTSTDLNSYSEVLSLLMLAMGRRVRAPNTDRRR